MTSISTKTNNQKPIESFVALVDAQGLLNKAKYDIVNQMGIDPVFYMDSMRELEAYMYQQKKYPDTIIVKSLQEGSLTRFKGIINEFKNSKTTVLLLNHLKLWIYPGDIHLPNSIFMQWFNGMQQLLESEQTLLRKKLNLPTDPQISQEIKNVEYRNSRIVYSRDRHNGFD